MNRRVLVSQKLAELRCDDPAVAKYINSELRAHVALTYENFRDTPRLSLDNTFTGSIKVGSPEGLASIPSTFDGNFIVAMPGDVSGPIFARNLAAGTGQSLGMAVAFIPPDGAIPNPGDGLGYIFAAPDGDGDLQVYASSEGQIVSSTSGDEEGKWQIWLLHNGADHVPFFEFFATGTSPLTGLMTAPTSMDLALGANGTEFLRIDTTGDVTASAAVSGDHSLDVRNTSNNAAAYVQERLLNDAGRRLALFITSSTWNGGALVTGGASGEQTVIDSDTLPLAIHAEDLYLLSNDSIVINAPRVIRAGTPQTLTGNGAVNLTTWATLLVTTGANALTLADGAEGQEKFIKMKTDGGDGTLTPSNLANGTTITFNDAGDTAHLIFLDGEWCMFGGTATLA